MAGKAKKQGSRPSTPKTPVTPEGLQGPLKGHLGLKSSPFCVTDAKLVNQYLVQDRMNAHYKKISHAKSAVDTAPPKAWLVSQKVRDQARREAVRQNANRRNEWESKNAYNQPLRPNSSASSEADREELLAMYQSRLDGDYDELDGRPVPQKDASHTSREVHAPDSNIDVTVTDNGSSHDKNGRHATQKMRPSSGRREKQFRGGATVVGNNLGATMRITKPQTPRTIDPLDTQSYKFTEEKPFQPRTLKNNATSKLSEFKYYNAPKRRPPEAFDNRNVTVTRTNHANGQGSRGVTQTLRPTTPMTLNSTELMNETLMSRDYNAKTPTGVPPLDISLDKDHVNWLREQSHKANVRGGHTSRSELGTTQALSRTQKGMIAQTADQNSDMMGTGLNGNIPQNGNLTYYGGTFTGQGRMSGEEELKYLEFIQEVTNDVLDRGIFTNRVLKQVFETHIRRRTDLKASRMREMLAELQQDLGIPFAEEGTEDDMGLASTLNNTDQYKSFSYKQAADLSGNMNGLSFGDGRRSESPVNGTYNAKKRDSSPNWRPPLPRPNSRGPHSRQGSREEAASPQPFSSVDQEAGLAGDTFVKSENVLDDMASVGENSNHNNNNNDFDEPDADLNDFILHTRTDITYAADDLDDVKVMNNNNKLGSRSSLVDEDRQSEGGRSYKSDKMSVGRRSMLDELEDKRSDLILSDKEEDKQSEGGASDKGSVRSVGRQSDKGSVKSVGRQSDKGSVRSVGRQSDKGSVKSEGRHGDKRSGGESDQGSMGRRSPDGDVDLKPEKAGSLDRDTGAGSDHNDGPEGSRPNSAQSSTRGSADLNLTKVTPRNSDDMEDIKKFPSLGDSMDYDDEFEDADLTITEETKTPKSDRPKPTPRKRSIVPSSGSLEKKEEDKKEAIDSARTLESDSIGVSELDDDEF